MGVSGHFSHLSVRKQWRESKAGIGAGHGAGLNSKAYSQYFVHRTRLFYGQRHGRSVMNTKAMVTAVGSTEPGLSAEQEAK